ncbi:MAG: LysE family transporter [Burkholderiaceae bacterium]|nr:LysE family transporter [Burkholderiaceae bacterium]MCD8517281.1 LysE family transporter [Burkholderiaceae bacterium]MCD8537815.1 LysE family transporter [Burkholderiaceae bacterium]MCD8564569.1 LysE family transporter [Burkholderiaceae bacterium]
MMLNTLPLFASASLTAFTAGMALSLSLIIAIGPQNAHLLRMGLQRQYLWLSVAVCAVADMVLIAIGVVGLAQLGQLSERLYGALLGATVLVLLLYGWQAAQRFWHGVKTTHQEVSVTDSPMSRRQAITAALAFSWLNPHAWIDTAVLIGGASLAYQAEARAGFGMGAMAGSLIWFLALGTLACWLGRRLGQSWVWRWIDGFVALMMWGIALTIAWGLLAA